AASLLAVLLLLVAGGIGALAYRDFQQNRVTGDYALAILSIESDISAAERAADRKPPDNELARQRIDHARVALDAAARSPAAVESHVASLREQIAALDDRSTGVVADLTPDDSETWKSVDALAVFVANLYILDATSGQVWKHESFPGTSFLRAVGYLTQPIPAGVGRSIAVDQDIWIITTQGEILRFR